LASVIIDRRNRHQIAHQFILALRHQRFIGGLGVRHHQQRVAVGRRSGDLLRADHSAGAGPVLDHEGLLEILLHGIAEYAGRHVRRTPGPERNDDPDRPRRIVLCQAWASKKGLKGEDNSRQRQREP
jgi:hypothetical protein